MKNSKKPYVAKIAARQYVIRTWDDKRQIWTDSRTMSRTEAYAHLKQGA